ncbi:MAG TPA: type II secretion system protein GspL, partial [Janthinobacterium sp.]|nr:type II secretion system protein GspL [Janthinobacterium sp.]
WKRWRWPLRLAALALLVNIAGLNLQWLRMKRDADMVHASILQTFRAAYPKETVIVDAALQMRRNIAAAKANGGQAASDEFNVLAAAYGEALSALPRKDVTAALEYRERALFVKLKPDTVDAAAQGRIKAALAARKLQLSEPKPGTWQIRPADSGAGTVTKPREPAHE